LVNKWETWRKPSGKMPSAYDWFRQCCTVS